MRLAERVGSRRNNFNALRLIAALMVLVSHCFALTNHTEPLGSISGETLGELGVSIFFAISGFLIARSWCDDPVIGRFLLKRALRLIPALVVAVLVTALVVGPLVTVLSPSGYFGSTRRISLRRAEQRPVHGQRPSAWGVRAQRLPGRREWLAVDAPG